MPTVLILGANGKIGSHSAIAFADAGWSVRRYVRGTDMTAAALGCDVLINGLNPPAYHDWDRIVPAITKQVIAAAQASGATVIIPGNLYNFGDQAGVWSENTPQRPAARKGQIRVEMEEAYRAAGVRTVILRAGNFIDPNHNEDVMSSVLLRNIKRGVITLPGDASVMQAYAYVPDWARAALMLAEKRDSLATFEDVPFPGHAFTAEDLRHALEGIMGQHLKFKRFPWWAMALLSPVWELAQELSEMRYLYNTAHRLCSKKFDALLPDFRPTETLTVMRSGLPKDIVTEGHSVGAGYSAAQ
ncbi:NAD-dependent epimerase/dehydratase family protein [Sulfitobacter delicatus]|uniref:Nucleoside-diphosphate-sugar epimerase n=1 Tax=Sulfitobacter delicatus TaxID=218672 RepID=A0A1G7QPX4_9RHOB|nr:NAD-dependent epimerase/dehydratase family protein [Sulfitobacter delicatus]SDG00533.1 Nucleoside-diphosphate-sugar epimerase [Sulfitobacter delicatus]